MHPGEEGLSTWLSIWTTRPRATGLSRNRTGGNWTGKQDAPAAAESTVWSGQHSQPWTSTQRGAENKVRDEAKIVNPVETGWGASPITQIRAEGYRIWNLRDFAQVFAALGQLPWASLWCSSLAYSQGPAHPQVFWGGGEESHKVSRVSKTMPHCSGMVNLK